MLKTSEAKRREKACAWVRERKRERKKGCVRGDPVKMWQIERTWGRALGAESNG